MCMYIYLNIHAYKVLKVDLHITCIHTYIIENKKNIGRNTLDCEIWSNCKLFNEPFVHSSSHQNPFSPLFQKILPIPCHITNTLVRRLNSWVGWMHHSDWVTFSSNAVKDSLGCSFFYYLFFTMSRFAWHCFAFLALLSMKNKMKNHYSRFILIISEINMNKEKCEV